MNSISCTHRCNTLEWQNDWTSINPNTKEQIVQAMVGVLAYNLAENDEKIKFDYNSNAYQNSHEIEDGLEL